MICCGIEGCSIIGVGPAYLHFGITVQPGRGSHTGLDFAGLLVEGLYAPKEDSFCVVALWDARMNLWPYIQPLCLGAVPELATFNILKIK